MLQTLTANRWSLQFLFRYLSKGAHTIFNILQGFELYVYLFADKTNILYTHIYMLTFVPAYTVILRSGQYKQTKDKK